MSQLTIKHSPVFTKLYEAIQGDKRFIVAQGGSRSSKTYSLCQLILIYAMTNRNKIVSIVRRSFPSLRGSVYRDFISIMKDLGVYTVKNHNKTENIISFDTGTIVEFFSVDDEQKIRGRKRDILWANEANELDFEQFNQLNMRTTEKLIFDYNPSDNYSWLYELLERPDHVLIKSTYKDNPFLSEGQRNEIENLKNIDEGYYRIYALGERAATKTTIFTNWVSEYFDKPDCDHIVYGLDFGFTNPSTLVECRFAKDMVYVSELIYEPGLTSYDMIRKMNTLDMDKRRELICDGARPEIIEDLRRNGYQAKAANKSIVDGINSVKMSRLNIHPESINLIKEIQNYKWKTAGDNVLDEPVKLHDHAIDAMRYAIHWHKIKTQRTDPIYFRIGGIGKKI